MLPAPAGINESCSGLETRGQSDLNFVVLSCAKLLLTMKPSTECATERSLLQKGEMRLCCPFTCWICLWLQGRLECGPGNYQWYSYWILYELCLADSAEANLKYVQYTLTDKAPKILKEPTLIHTVTDHIWVHLTTHPLRMCLGTGNFGISNLDFYLCGWFGCNHFYWGLRRSPPRPALLLVGSADLSCLFASSVIVDLVLLLFLIPTGWENISFG